MKDLLAKPKKPMDRWMLIIIGLLVLAGILIFLSAALSVLPKNSALFQRMVISQLVFALLGGGIGLFVVSRIPFRTWQQYALPLAIVGFVLTALVFVPGLGFSHGGARRWLDLGPISLQPAELFKYALVIYWAAFLTWAGKRIKEWRLGFVALGIFAGLAGIILLLQPDTVTFLVILAALAGLYFLAGAPLKHLGALALVAIIAFGGLVAMRPYLLDRIKTFHDPMRDPTGSSYQIRQSIISVGSGEVFGRGYGRSAQKFQYLPEPVGDSIFAVASEELGFVGSLTLLILYGLFAWRGIYIARRAPNQFARLLVSGIVILIVVQSGMNIASILGLMPLTGLPLVFVSHGGTALLISLSACGIILQVSRYIKTTPQKPNVVHTIMSNQKKTS